MAEIKSLDAIQEKYSRVTPGRRDDYLIGVTNPKRPWKSSAKAAVGTYKAAMTESISKDLYNKGLDKVTDTDWQGPAVDIGPGRFAEGTMKAGPKFGKGFAKIHAAFKGVVKQPRFPRGDLRNLKNVELFSQAAYKAKIS